MIPTFLYRTVTILSYTMPDWPLSTLLKIYADATNKHDTNKYVINKVCVCV